MAPVRTLAAPLSVLLGALGARARDASVLLQTASLVESRSEQSSYIDTFGPMVKEQDGHDINYAEYILKSDDRSLSDLHPVAATFHLEISALQRETEIELERRKALPEESVRGLPRVSKADLGALKSLDSMIKGAQNIGTTERQEYFRNRLQKYYLKLHGSPENTSYFIAQGGDSCREGPSMYIERMLYQIGKYPKKNPSLQFAADPGSLKPGTCASAGYSVASEWSGCFPAARAWVRQGPVDIELEEKRASWEAIAGNGNLKAWTQQVQALCFNTFL